MEHARRRQIILLAVVSIMQAAWLAMMLYANTWYWKQPYHTSMLSREAWVDKLIYGHPERIRTCLGMCVHVFLALVAKLRMYGLSDSRYVALKEKVAIFLYTCVTGLPTEHVGERFQRSNDTITKYVPIIYKRPLLTRDRYFVEVLMAISLPGFYGKYVQLPRTDDPTLSSILNNPKWFPYFEGAVGAMDGTHIDCCPSAIPSGK